MLHLNEVNEKEVAAAAEKAEAAAAKNEPVEELIHCTFTRRLNLD